MMVNAARHGQAVLACHAVLGGGDGVAAAGNGQLVLDTTPWPAWASMVRFPEPLRVRSVLENTTASMLFSSMAV